MVMTQCPFEPGQNAHVDHGVHPPLFVGIIKRPGLIAYTMKPAPDSSYVDTGFIRMGHIRGCQLMFCPLFKVAQKFKGFFVKIENRTLTDRYMKLVGKIILYPVVWNQLEL